MRVFHRAIPYKSCLQLPGEKWERHAPENKLHAGGDVSASGGLAGFIHDGSGRDQAMAAKAQRARSPPTSRMLHHTVSHADVSGGLGAFATIPREQDVRSVGSSPLRAANRQYDLAADAGVSADPRHSEPEHAVETTGASAELARSQAEALQHRNGLEMTRRGADEVRVREADGVSLFTSDAEWMREVDSKARLSRSASMTGEGAADERGVQYVNVRQAQNGPVGVLVRPPASHSARNASAPAPQSAGTATPQHSKPQQVSQQQQQQQPQLSLATGGEAPAGVPSALLTGDPSPRRGRLHAASPIAVDVNQLARIRKQLRDELPRDPEAAAAVVRLRLTREDADHDGVVSANEVHNAVRAITHNLSAQETDMMIRFLQDTNLARAAPHLGVVRSPSGRGTPTKAGTKPALAAALQPGIDATQLVDWILRQPGGSSAAGSGSRPGTATTLSGIASRRESATVKPAWRR